MIFLPIFFICTVTNDCDFMAFEVTNDKERCEISVKRDAEILNNNPLVKRFVATCIQIDNAVLIQKKGNV